MLGLMVVTQIQFATSLQEHTVTVSDPFSGCVETKSIVVNEPNPIVVTLVN